MPNVLERQFVLRSVMFRHIRSKVDYVVASISPSYVYRIDPWLYYIGVLASVYIPRRP